MQDSTDVIIETTGALGRIRLNRPKAINALTLDMIRRIVTALEQFAADAAVGLVLITGEGERGLCAGGDIRALYDHGRDKSNPGEVFFRDEYRMNAQIATYKKPYIAVMDGITMGGGVGISAHGALRIVTERTRMAMPETGIGFFPDVGGTWLLSHAPGEIGTFMGMSGESFGGADAIYAQFADVFVQSAKLPALIEALAALPASTTLAQARAAVAAFSEAAPVPLAAHRALIDRCFAFDTVEEIFAALAASDDAFAHKALETLQHKSPTSLKVTLKLLRLARQDKDLQESLEREFAATYTVLASDNFYEGVRAAVVDKDRNPKWSPATVAEVPDTMVAQYLRPASIKLF